MRPLSLSSLAVCLVAVGAACNSDSTSPVTTQASIISQDIAVQTATDASKNLAMVANSETVTGLSLVQSVPGTASMVIAAPPLSWTRTCSGPDAQGFYTCGTQREDDNLTVTRSHRFWAGGTPVPTSGAPYDSVQYRWSEVGVDTADADHRASDASSLIRWINRGDTASVAFKRTVTPNQRIWNWVGARNDSSRTVGTKGTRFYRITGNRVGTNVTYTVPRSANPWPVSGSIAHNWSATSIFTAPGGTKADTSITSGSTTITFDGTQTPKVKVGGLTCTIDLKTHRTSNCS